MEELEFKPKPSNPWPNVLFHRPHSRLFPGMPLTEKIKIFIFFVRKHFLQYFLKLIKQITI